MLQLLMIIKIPNKIKTCKVLIVNPPKKLYSIKNITITYKLNNKKTNNNYNSNNNFSSNKYLINRKGKAYIRYNNSPKSILNLI